MDRRVEKTKASIREAYFELLLKYKTEKITITQIASQANIDRKTFYLHYDSIEDILSEFAQTKIDELIQHLRTYTNDGQPIEVQSVFRALNQILQENIEFFRFIALNKKYDYFFDRLKELFISVIYNDYRSCFSFSDSEFLIYADYFVSGILSAYMRWLKESLSIDLDQLAGLVSNAAFTGLKGLLPSQF